MRYWRGKMMDKELKASREKHWDELDDLGKIERLRSVVKDQQRVIARMANYIDLLINHEHLDGKMVQPIRHPNAESYGSVYYHKKRGDDWF